MPKRVILDHVQIGRDGPQCVRVLKQVTLGGEVHSSEPHVHTIEPGTSLEDSLVQLTDCLTLNGWPALSDEDADFVTVLSEAARGVA